MRGDRKLRLLDICCCAGGCSVGYAQAGFEVVGVDINPQPNYPFEFRHGSLLDLDADEIWLEFDAVAASPPCQHFSRTHSIHRAGRQKGGNGGYKVPRARDARDDHPNLIPETRELLLKTGLPYVIENVQDAQRELIKPIMLCGEMFGLKTYRHRVFETNWPIGKAPPHPRHSGVATGTGHSETGKGVGYSAFSHGATMITVAGNNFNRKDAMAAMEIDWNASQREVAQMIPPAYTKWIGERLRDHILYGDLV